MCTDMHRLTGHPGNQQEHDGLWAQMRGADTIPQVGKDGQRMGRVLPGAPRDECQPFASFLSLCCSGFGGEQDFGPCGILPWFVLAVTLSSCSEQKQQKSCGFPVRSWRLGPAQLLAHCKFLASHETFLFLSFHICLLGVVR